MTKIHSLGAKKSNCSLIQDWLLNFSTAVKTSNCISLYDTPSFSESQEVGIKYLQKYFQTKLLLWSHPCCIGRASAGSFNKIVLLLFIFYILMISSHRSIIVTAPDSVSQPRFITLDSKSLCQCLALLVMDDLEQWRQITKDWTLPAQKEGQQGGELKVTEFAGSFLISRRGTYSRKNFQTSRLASKIWQNCWRFILNSLSLSAFSLLLKTNQFVKYITDLS